MLVTAVMEDCMSILVSIVGFLLEIKKVFLCFGVWNRLGVCKLCESLFCKLEIHITGTFIELPSSYHEKRIRCLIETDGAQLQATH